MYVTGADPSYSRRSDSRLRPRAAHRAGADARTTGGDDADSPARAAAPYEDSRDGDSCAADAGFGSRAAVPVRPIALDEIPRDVLARFRQ